MKKLILIFLTVILIISVQATTQEEKQAYKECNQDCKESKTILTNNCSTEFSECKTNCANLNSCIRECSKEKNDCLKSIKEEQRTCKAQCKQILAPKCTFEEKTYFAGETFQNECDICECKMNEKISCKREPFCNKDPKVSELLCTESGGLYQAICKGSLFSMVCYPAKFCICDGIYGYSCPQNHECFKDFKIKVRDNGLPDYTNQLGLPLGNIGICVSNSTHDQ